MKTYNNLYGTLVSEKTRAKAVRNVIRGRKHMKNLNVYAANPTKTVDYAYSWIVNYRKYPHRPIQIYDGISRKKRWIIVPTFEELTVQHCVVSTLMPMFMHGMYEHSYASIPDRGAHKAKKVIENWVKHDEKNCKYILKMDIHHFFDSIPHEILKAKLAKKLKDKNVLELCYKIIDTTEKGLPLGFYTSQWFSNWYLEGLDHFIKEQLGAVHYVRYMDDMVIFGSNKRKLHKMREAIGKYLNDELGLELKDDWQVFRFDFVYKVHGKIQYDKKGNPIHHGRDLDFMGFRFFRNKTTLRRSIYYKACRKAKRISRKWGYTVYDARQMLSCLGWIDCTDTYRAYEKYIKPYVKFRLLKHKVSQFDKRKAKERKQYELECALRQSKPIAA